MVRLTILAAVVLAVAAPPVQAQNAQFRCPASGTVVEQSVGTRISYRGQDAGDPLVCRTADGQRRFLGYWSASSLFYRAGGVQLARLLMGGSREERINYFSPGRDGNSVHIFETWRVLGTNPLETTAGTFDALRVQRQFEVAGSAYSYLETIWLDRASGAPVKVEVNHLNGFMAPNVMAWEATDLRTGTPRSPGS